MVLHVIEAAPARVPDVENRTMSATARFVNASLAQYHVLRHLDVPKIDVIWNDIPDPHAPLGVHGIGEIGIAGVAAAIANAANESETFR